MKNFMKKMFKRSFTSNVNTHFSTEKVEQISAEVMKKYEKTFADLARYDRKEIGVHELSH